MKSVIVTIQMKVKSQCFPVVLFVVPYKMKITCNSIDEILEWDNCLLYFTTCV